MAQLKRKGWLSPEEAQKLRDEIADLKGQLEIAQLSLQIIDELEARADELQRRSEEDRAEIKALSEAIARLESEKPRTIN